MAAYNGELYISRQIASIIQQLGPDDEIIIVDDNSKDKTVDIINSFKDPRIKLIQNEKNLGIIKTFEKTLENAKGEFVFLSDQDDEWMENKISIVMDVFLNSEVDLIRHDAIITDLSGKVLYDSWNSLLSLGPGILKNFYRNTYTGCCMAFRRTVIQAVIPIAIGVQAHDQWIGIMAEAYGFHVKFINNKLMKYIRHEANCSPMNRRKLITVYRGRVQLFKSILIHLLMNRKK